MFFETPEAVRAQLLQIVYRGLAGSEVEMRTVKLDEWLLAIQALGGVDRLPPSPYVKPETL